VGFNSAFTDKQSLRYFSIGFSGQNVLENVCPEDWAIRKEGKHRLVELYKR
jgi:hypothetical protein